MCIAQEKKYAKGESCKGENNRVNIKHITLCKLTFLGHALVCDLCLLYDHNFCAAQYAAY